MYDNVILYKAIHLEVFNMKTVLSLFTIVGVAFALQAALLYQINGLNDGAHVNGPKLTEKDLEGKVLLIEEWGKDCPPCIGSLPHMQKVYEKFSKTGKFMLIGSHCQQRIDEEIIARLTKAGAEYPVYQFIGIKGAPSSNGIPFAYLVDHTGKVVWSGHPSECESAIAAAIKVAPTKIPGSIIGNMDIKYNKGVIKQLCQGKNIEPALKSLAAKATKDDDTGKEATKIIARCDEWLEEQIAAIEEMKAVSPSQTVQLISTLKRTWPTKAADYTETYDTLMKSLDVQKLIQIRATFTKLASAKITSKSKAKQAAASFKSLSKRIEPITQSEDTAIAADATALLKDIEAKVATLQDE